MRSSFVIVLLTAVGMGIFALQNHNVIQVKFIKFAWNTSQSIVIMASALFGFLGGVLAMLPGAYKRWRKVKGLEKEMGSIKREKQAPVVIEDEKADDTGESES